MNAQQKDRALWLAIHYRAAGERDALPAFAQDHARTLRRAQLTLHRWAEEMCNGTIQRDGEQGDGKPFRVTEYGGRWGLTNKWAKHPVPDRERGALARVAKVCKEAGLHYYHQTDPRGCALYVGAEPLNDQNYSTKGVPCL